MLVRIVKMTFVPEKTDEFEARFQSVKQDILKFEGCDFLELYRDRKHANIYFTYSYWRSEKDLDHYRNSNFFKEVWSGTKKLFSEKPEAWSVDKIVSLNNKTNR